MTQRKAKFAKDVSLAATRLDTQGETKTKAFLQALLRSMPPRIPLHREHDMQLSTMGSAENLRLVPDPADPRDWQIIADVTFFTDTIAEAIGGFSYSATALLPDSDPAADGQVFIPYPHYNDDVFMNSLREANRQIAVGRFYRKAADPASIALYAITFGLFVLKPVWENFYSDVIWPKLLAMIEQSPKLLDRGMSYDVQIEATMPNGNKFDIYFMPTRGHEGECVSKENIRRGIAAAKLYVDADEKARSVGVTRVKLSFDPEVRQFKLLSIHYKDGTEAPVGAQ